MRTLPIEIISDVMCPWCYVGKKRLERALAERPDLSVEITWRPFQLDATIPPEGMDRQEYVSAKFGTGARAREIYDNLVNVGEAEGIPFAFDRIARSPNTLDAHRLIRWSHALGEQDAAVEALFTRYFVDGEDIGDRAVLLEIAEELGFDRTEIEERFDDEADRAAVADQVAEAQAMGVTGVPCFIVDRTYVVMGAQDPLIIGMAIDKALLEN